MLKKIFKWLGIIVLSIIVLFICFYGVVYFKTQASINKVYDVKLQNLVIPTDSASYALGRHLAENRGCLGCHNADLGGGEAFLDDKNPLGILYAKNITSGNGGIQYSNEDWVRALRHGLGKDHKTLWFMPSHEICHISNQEMAALIGFLKLQKPVDRTNPQHSIKPLGRILSFLGKFPMFTAEMIDHSATYPEKVILAVDAKSGAYLATSCKGCHSPTFKGAEAHGPGQPNIPDITSTGNLGKWTDKDFVTLFRTGNRPNGKPLSMFMPAKAFTYTDEELKAIFIYLHGLK
jgi:cytochrome c2